MAIEVYLYQPYDEEGLFYEGEWVSTIISKKILYSTDDPKSYDFLPGVIKEEVNKAGSFEFDIYPEHPLYMKIVTFTTYIGVEDSNQTKYDHESYIFYGRIINYTIDPYGVKHVVCEGLLANLLDCPAYMPSDDRDRLFSITSEGSYWLFMYPLTAYDDLLDRQDILFGDVDYALRITSDEAMEYTDSLSQSCGEFITSLVDTFGGMLELVYSGSDIRVVGTLYWKTDPITEPNRFVTNSQVFKFGENIISASFDAADSDKFQYILPHATYPSKNGRGGGSVLFSGRNRGTTNHYIPAVLDGSGEYSIVGSSVHTQLPISCPYPIKAVQLEGIGNGKGGYSIRTFWKRASKYAKLHCNFNRADDVTVTGVDEYFIGKAQRRIHIMDRVRVVIPYANYDETKYCLSYELDIVNPANSQFKFGDYKPISSQKAYYISKRISSKK